MPNENQRQFEEPTLTEQGSLAAVTLQSNSDTGIPT
jgi:hypothetical protein